MHHTEDVPADGHIKDFKFMDQGLYPATSVRYIRNHVWGQSQNFEKSLKHNKWFYSVFFKELLESGKKSFNMM